MTSPSIKTLLTQVSISVPQKLVQSEPLATRTSSRFLMHDKILHSNCQQTQISNEAQSLPRLLWTFSERNQTPPDARNTAKEKNFQWLEKIVHLVCQRSLNTHSLPKNTETHTQTLNNTELKHIPPSHPEQGQG